MVDLSSKIRQVTSLDPLKETCCPLGDGQQSVRYRRLILNDRHEKRLVQTSVLNLALMYRRKTKPFLWLQLGHPHQWTWRVVQGSCLTAAAVGTGAGTTAALAPPPRHLSQRWTAAQMKACTWSWIRGRSLVPKGQRYTSASRTTEIGKPNHWITLNTVLVMSLVYFQFIKETLLIAEYQSFKLKSNDVETEWN